MSAEIIQFPKARSAPAENPQQDNPWLSNTAAQPECPPVAQEPEPPVYIDSWEVELRKTNRLLMWVAVLLGIDVLF